MSAANWAAEISTGLPMERISPLRTSRPHLVDDWQKTDVSLVELATARVTPVVATEAAETQPVFSPEGKLSAYTASETPPQWAFASRVFVVKPNGQDPHPLAETFDLKPGIVGWSKTGDTRARFRSAADGPAAWAALPLDGTAGVDISPAGLMVGQPAINSTHTHVESFCLRDR